ncbi:hypothetical protein CYMTET_16608 [Cymbomonas tetramitiformis]|uniref:Uncharacterized protein n=1 Tax=Cymbomonas tetramitiformis TaxID=36881 RepID=A0AAE0GC56_9CHLO|nr:hypothetical protein CYMTET_16608 [Cymbomonas tetramitiformis]
MLLFMRMPNECNISVKTFKEASAQTDIESADLRAILTVQWDRRNCKESIAQPLRARVQAFNPAGGPSLNPRARSPSLNPCGRGVHRSPLRAGVIAPQPPGRESIAQTLRAESIAQPLRRGVHRSQPLRARSPSLNLRAESTLNPCGRGPSLSPCGQESIGLRRRSIAQPLRARRSSSLNPCGPSSSQPGSPGPLRAGVHRSTPAGEESIAAQPLRASLRARSAESIAQPLRARGPSLNPCGRGVHRSTPAGEEALHTSSWTRYCKVDPEQRRILLGAMAEAAAALRGTGEAARWSAGQRGTMLAKEVRKEQRNTD